MAESRARGHPAWSKPISVNSKACKAARVRMSRSAKAASPFDGRHRTRPHAHTPTLQPWQLSLLILAGWGYSFRTASSCTLKSMRQVASQRQPLLAHEGLPHALETIRQYKTVCGPGSATKHAACGCSGERSVARADSPCPRCKLSNTITTLYKQPYKSDMEIATAGHYPGSISFRV